MKKINLEELRISINGCKEPLPDWASAAIQLGAYARYTSNQTKDHRLLLCCVVPCRDVFTALLGLGSVFAGSLLFKKSFDWDDLKNLKPGTEIFWKNKGDNYSYSGVIEPHEEMDRQILVPVNIKKPKKKAGRWFFSESKFRDCIFSEENLPSAQTYERFKDLVDFYSILGCDNASKWLETAGSEVRLITNNSKFRQTLDKWLITTELDSKAISPEHLMILRDETDPAFAKARLTHHLGKFIRDCPVTILDGPLAFQCISDIQVGSLVVVLETGELSYHHIDLLSNASSEHSEEVESLLYGFNLENITPSIEITGYCLNMV